MPTMCGCVRQIVDAGRSKSHRRESSVLSSFGILDLGIKFFGFFVLKNAFFSLAGAY